MFVAYENVYGGILLREVNTEEEAYAEMRRFTEVNHISSDVTEIYWVEEKENLHHIRVPRHKKVVMTAGFGIYYDEPPPYTKLGSRSKWGITSEWFDEFNPSYHFNPTLKRHVCWYDEVAAYLKDLSKRKAGGG